LLRCAFQEQLANAHARLDAGLSQENIEALAAVLKSVTVSHDAAAKLTLPPLVLVMIKQLSSAFQRNKQRGSTS